MTNRADLRCVVCGDVLCHMQRMVCSPHCRSIHNFGVRSHHSDEMKDRLAVMWHAGEKVAVIALALGVSVNVIVSLRRRIPLPERPNPVKRLPSGQAPKPRRYVVREPRVTLPQFGPYPALGPLPPIQFVAPRKPPQHKAPELRPAEPKPERPNEPRRQCAWLDGDKPHWRQCTNTAVSNCPYCEQHRDRAYVRTPRISTFGMVA